MLWKMSVVFDMGSGASTLTSTGAVAVAEFTYLHRAVLDNNLE